MEPATVHGPVDAHHGRHRTVTRSDEPRDRLLRRRRCAAVEWVTELHHRRDRIALEAAHAGGLDERTWPERLQHAHGREVRRSVMRDFGHVDGSREVRDPTGHRIAPMPGEIAAHERACQNSMLGLRLDQRGDAPCVLGDLAPARACTSGRGLLAFGMRWRPQDTESHVTRHLELVTLRDGNDSASSVLRMPKHRRHRSAWGAARSLDRMGGHQHQARAHGVDDLRHGAEVVEVGVRHDDGVESRDAQGMKRRHHRAAAERGRAQRSRIEQDGRVARADQVA
jgi:hypothetical protein